MATFCGDDVEVACAAGLVANGSDWSIEITSDVYEKTAGWSATDDWKEYCKSWKEWGGSWNGKADDTSKIPCDVDTCTATFTLTTGISVTGDIIIQNITINAVHKGQITYTVTFKGDGPVSCPGDTP